MRNRPYQRRRRLPVVAIVTVLAIATVAIWVSVITGKNGATGGQACPAPAAGPAPGQVLAKGALDGVAPVPAADVHLHVLNAGGQRGQANLVGAELGDLGFAQASAPSNDPFFPAGDMRCKSQIRFGPAGKGAASTVSVVLPCAELVRDARADDTVDVAVGTAFGDLNPPKSARDVLDQLTTPPTGDTSTAVDPTTLTDARNATC